MFINKEYTSLLSSTTMQQVYNMELRVLGIVALVDNKQEENHPDSQSEVFKKIALIILKK